MSKLGGALQGRVLPLFFSDTYRKTKDKSSENSFWDKLSTPLANREENLIWMGVWSLQPEDE